MERRSIKWGVIRNQYQEIKNVILNNDTEFVNKQLRKIKEHAIKTTEFYKNYSVDSIFPIVNKRIITENKNEFLARSGFAVPLHISSTSGSTGTPFSVVQDYKKRMRVIAELKVFGELADYPSHERLIQFRALTSHMKRTPEQEDKENIYYIDCGDMSNEGLKMMKSSIIDKKPSTIFGYSNTLVELAKYFYNTGIPEDIYFIKSIVATSERLYEEDRLFIEKIFGCKVYIRYSDMELGILAQDNGDAEGYNLNWGSYYFECLKLDKDEAVDNGEVGRIVITDLFNFAMPMIRYDTGDLGIVKYTDNMFFKFKEIYGRKIDCIYTTDGVLISPHRVNCEMWGIEKVKQWQFIQEDQKLYVMKLNADKNIDTSIMINKIKNIIGIDAVIKIEFVDEIPVLSSNKRRNVICKYRRQ